MSWSDTSTGLTSRRRATLAEPAPTTARRGTGLPPQPRFGTDARWITSESRATPVTRRMGSFRRTATALRWTHATSRALVAGRGGLDVADKAQMCRGRSHPHRSGLVVHPDGCAGSRRKCRLWNALAVANRVRPAPGCLVPQAQLPRPDLSGGHDQPGLRRVGDGVPWFRGARLEPHMASSTPKRGPHGTYSRSHVTTGFQSWPGILLRWRSNVPQTN